MPMTYSVGGNEVRAIKELRKKNDDNQTDKRLRAAQLRGAGIKKSPYCWKHQLIGRV